MHDSHGTDKIHFFNRYWPPLPLLFTIVNLRSLFTRAVRMQGQVQMSDTPEIPGADIRNGMFITAGSGT
jgi:hypothetical protein